MKLLALTLDVPEPPSVTGVRPTVMLVGGPYDGQDVRITAMELRSGSVLRGEQQYLRTDGHSSLGTGMRIPLFKWAANLATAEEPAQESSRTITLQAVA